MMMILPPNESCNKKVSLEFLKGMWVLFLLPNADITSPGISIGISIGIGIGISISIGIGISISISISISIT